MVEATQMEIEKNVCENKIRNSEWDGMADTTSFF